MAFGFSVQDLGVEQGPISATTNARPSGGDSGGDNENGRADKVSITPDGNATAELQGDIITAGVENESAIALGAGAAVTTNGDVTRSAEEIAEDEAAYVQAVDRGVREGLTRAEVDQITIADTHISQARREELYAEVAENKYGTSDEEVAQQQQAQAEQNIAALQSGVLGSGLLGALDSMTGQTPAVTDERSAEPNNPFAALLAGFESPKLAMADMGNTGAFLANHDNIQHGLANGPEQRERGAALMV